MAGTYKAILTFDDGPLSDETRKPKEALKTILTVLGDRGIRGVFYVLGDEVRTDPESLKDIHKAGHVIQNHSWSHRKLPTLSKEELTKDLQDTQQIIQKHIGKKPNRLRPPYGNGWVDFKDKKLMEVATSIGLTLTGWDIDTNDWNAKNQGLQTQYFDPKKNTWKAMYTKRLSPLDILMHVKGVTARALAGFIDGLTAEGWQFTTYPDDSPQATPASQPSQTKPASQQHWVQIFAGSQKGALEKLKEAETLGYKNVALILKNGSYKVRVGPYATRSEAETALSSLKTQIVDAFIVVGDP